MDEEKIMTAEEAVRENLLKLNLLPNASKEKQPREVRRANNIIERTQGFINRNEEEILGMELEQDTDNFLLFDCDSIE